MTAIEDRIMMTHKGQVTWAQPSIGAKCASCAHYFDGKVVRGKNKGFGRCALVKAHTRKAGVLFDGEKATACSMFMNKSELAQ
jgi:hypothetical protein